MYSVKYAINHVQYIYGLQGIFTTLVIKPLILEGMDLWGEHYTNYFQPEKCNTFYYNMYSFDI